MARKHLTKRQKADLDRRTIADDSERQRVLNVGRSPFTELGRKILAQRYSSEIYDAPTQTRNPITGRTYRDNKLGVSDIRLIVFEDDEPEETPEETSDEKGKED